jgi:polysaccharide export outer membrane protein
MKLLVMSSAVVLLLLLGGCSSSSRVEKNYYDQTALNPGRGKLPEYRLGFGDEIEVKFFNNDVFNETIAVRPDGRITIQKIGDIFVAGMTPSELDSLITTRYAEIIKSPEVTVFVRKFGGYQVYVLGEVERPGSYAVERDLTLVQTLAAAGGVKNSAKLGSIMVLRPGKEGAISALKVDVSDYLKGRRFNVYIAEKDLEVSMNEFYMQPQDIVYVPTTVISDISTFMTQVYAGLLPPVDVYLRALWYRAR